MPQPHPMPEMEPSLNVLGGPLHACSLNPKTGFFRDGCCNTSDEDRGRHTVCVRMTIEFLLFSRARGNDLMTPAPQHGFKGLQPGDQWCLCVERWKEALEAGAAPAVVLQATHLSALQTVTLDQLLEHAVAVSV